MQNTQKTRLTVVFYMPFRLRSVTRNGLCLPPNGVSWLLPLPFSCGFSLRDHMEALLPILTTSSPLFPPCSAWEEELSLFSHSQVSPYFFIMVVALVVAAHNVVLPFLWFFLVGLEVEHAWSLPNRPRYGSNKTTAKKILSSKTGALVLVRATVLQYVQQEDKRVVHIGRSPVCMEPRARTIPHK